jgi:hypothetical protein
MEVVMNQSKIADKNVNLSQISTQKRPIDYLTTYGMWLATAVLAGYQIALVPNIVISIYARLTVLFDQTTLTRSTFEAAALGQGATIVMAIFAITIIIGGFEYHRKHVGETRSLKVLIWTLGIQLSILVLGFII